MGSVSIPPPLMAGVVGLEPTLGLLSLVPESKSGALPLGDTPV